MTHWTEDVIIGAMLCGTFILTLMAVEYILGVILNNVNGRDIILGVAVTSFIILSILLFRTIGQLFMEGDKGVRV